MGRPISILSRWDQIRMVASGRQTVPGRFGPPNRSEPAATKALPLAKKEMELFRSIHYSFLKYQFGFYT
jgi:hypothetical protein